MVARITWMNWWRCRCCDGRRKPTGSGWVIRFLTREEIEGASDRFDFLVDIGMQYEPLIGRFDHHQGGELVTGRSAAGLVFDSLYPPHDRRRGWLKPIMDQVDRLDNGLPVNGNSLAGIPALLKAVGGFEFNRERSEQCLELIQALVDHWLKQAETLAVSDLVTQEAEPVGDGLFLPTDEHYGPTLRQHLASTAYHYIGFPGSPGRFLVVSLADPDGTSRCRFPTDLEHASFVHPRGFLAVFPSRDAARQSLLTWQERTQPCLDT